MVESLDSKSGLEKQIEKHVEKTGGLIAGEFEEASAQGIVKYAYSVYRAVEHLESLCSPIIDEEYMDEIPESTSDVDDKLQSKELNSVLETSDEKFRYLTRLLYRKGVL